MNWKKLLLFGLGGPVVAAVNNVIVGNAAGVHIPFTAGTVLLPAIPIVLKSIVALFTQPPNETPQQ